jgi:hypothetical protein
MEMILANALCAVSRVRVVQVRLDGNNENVWGSARVRAEKAAFQRAVPNVSARSASGRIASVSEPPVVLAMLRAEPVEVLG